MSWDYLFREDEGAAFKLPWGRMWVAGVLQRWYKSEKGIISTITLYRPLDF